MTDLPELIGFFKINNKEIFHCWYNKTVPGRYETFFRGINTVILNTNNCSTRDLKWFDTTYSHNKTSPSDPGSTQDLIKYIDGLPLGTVLLAITCDGTTQDLDDARPVLKAAGADIDVIGWRDMYSIVLQKGYPEKTVLVKRKHHICVLHYV